MFGVKTKILSKIKKTIREIDTSRSLSKIENYILISLIKKELKKEADIFDNQQVIIKKANHFASKIIKKTSNFMPNNLGNWSVKKPDTFTAKLEINFIETIKKLLGANEDIIGHFSSGTSEGNIYATWIARNYLQKNLDLKDSKKIVLIKSCLAHYSIDKAADIAGLKLVTTSIHKSKYNIDLKYLEKNLISLYNHGFRGFIIPLTLGYTVTGTDDEYLKIINLINKIKKEKTDCKFFLWFDAAYSGMLKGYVDNKFKPFANNNVKLLSTDLHKSLAVPYPASVLLYKKGLLNYIKKSIPYIDHPDTTLLGSRPGISVLASWFTLVNLSKKEITNYFNQAIERKNNFLKKISHENIDVQIINNKNSLQACLISLNKNSDQLLNKKYNLEKINYKLLIEEKIKFVKLYKLYFFMNLDQ
jgi:glutamate/tyrosine decarboxylase-like PLP-dependent enzyme